MIFRDISETADKGTNSKVFCYAAEVMCQVRQGGVKVTYIVSGRAGYNY